eukprot:GEMP01042945.1.p1 GENE.GEMP01042945.1~~GEMP01042945.1.p1  ORF type:complete len:225 (+),score=27.25 GEMP01042945.1:406-1080(+)
MKAGNMYLSFTAMKYTSLPVYNVLKRLNPVFSLFVDYAVRGSRVSALTLLSIAHIGIGAVVTGAGDFDFSIIPYIIGVTAAVFQASYLVFARRAQDKLPQLTHVDLLFYTAMYNCFIFMPLAILEFEDVREFCTEGVDVKLVMLLVMYLVMGAVLNYVTFWCTSVNSPLTTGVSGNVKGVLSTILGIMLYGSRLTFVGYVGLTLSFVGGLFYAFSKSKARKKED